MILYQEVFEIEAVAQERPRARIMTPKAKGKKPFVVIYDPAKSKKFKEDIRSMIMIKPMPIPLIDQPMIMSCRIYITRPKSITIAKRAYPEVKPDLSNYIKGIEDAMNGFVYTDDSKIIGYRDCFKFYVDDGPPRIEVRLFDVIVGFPDVEV